MPRRPCYSNAWCVLIFFTTGAQLGVQINTQNKFAHLAATPHCDLCASPVMLCCSCLCVCVFRQDISSRGWGIRGVIHSSHIHPHRSFILTLTGFSCSVSLTEGREGGRERDGGRMSRKGCEVGWVNGEIEMEWFEFYFLWRFTCYPAPSGQFEQKVTSCRGCCCICANTFFSIHLLNGSFSYTLPVMLYLHPHVFHSPSVHPSLSLGLASVGRFQSVCLLMTPLGADVMLSSCCTAASLPFHISFSPF